MLTLPTLILIFLASGYISYFIAKKRRAKTSYWTLLGVLLGPFVIPFVFLAKQDLEPSSATRK